MPPEAPSSFDCGNLLASYYTRTVEEAQENQEPESIM